MNLSTGSGTAIFLRKAVCTFLKMRRKTYVLAVHLAQISLNLTKDDSTKIKDV